MKLLTSAAIVLMLASPAFAADSVTLDVAESEEFGQYLADSHGRPVYVFSTDLPATDDQQAQLSCTSTECLQAWPPVTTSGDPQAGEGVDASLLGTAEHDGQQVVTYQGLPLYYSSDDEGAETPQGRDVEAFGGEWSLFNPGSDAVAGDIAAGETRFAMECAQCHGRTGRGMASFPSVAGRDAGYISDRLMQYRAHEAVGPNSALMFPVAAELSDEDIADLAAFISTTFE